MAHNVDSAVCLSTGQRSRSISSLGSSTESFETISRVISSDDDDDDIVYLRSPQECASTDEEPYVLLHPRDEARVNASVTAADELSSALENLSILPEPARSWSDQLDQEDRSTPKPLKASIASSIPLPKSKKGQASHTSAPVVATKSDLKGKSGKQKTEAAQEKQVELAASAYPSPATTPVPSSAKVSGTPSKTQLSKEGEGVMPPPLSSSQKSKKKKAKKTREATQSQTDSYVKASFHEFGGSVVDDMSEAGDAAIDKAGLLSNAYEEAVKFMNSFIKDPANYTSKASKLTFMQALILELGICHENVALPNTVTSAKALLKSHAFVNVRDYLRVRSQGREAIREVMHPSRSSLVRELRVKKKTAKLGWVKESGLAVLLVSCYQH